MKKMNSKNQIIEAISYWKKQLKTLNESEDKYDVRNGLQIISARDLILDQAVRGDIAVEEYDVIKNGAHNSISINPEMAAKIKVLCESDYDKYRTVLYYAPIERCIPANAHRFDSIIDAMNSEFGICSLDSYEEIMNKSFSDYEQALDQWPEEIPGWDKEIEEFIETYPTFESWKNAIAVKGKEYLMSGIKDFCEIDSNMIDVNSDGISYVIILWRS